MVIMVPRAGFEPATTRSSAGCSPRLSYLGAAQRVININTQLFLRFLDKLAICVRVSIDFSTYVNSEYT